MSGKKAAIQKEISLFAIVARTRCEATSNNAAASAVIDAEPMMLDVDESESGDDSPLLLDVLKDTAASRRIPFPRSRQAATSTFPLEASSTRGHPYQVEVLLRRISERHNRDLYEDRK